MKEWILDRTLQALYYKLDLPEGEEVDLGERVYRAVKIKRKEVISPAWREVFEKMAGLAEKHGDELVRLVVWFDW